MIKTLKNMAKFLLMFLAFMCVVGIFASIFSPDEITSASSLIDKHWITMTVIRLFILMFITLFLLPYWSKNRMNDAKRRYENILSDGEVGEDDEVETRLYNINTQIEFYQSVIANKYWMLLVFLFAEAIIVQLPHWI